MLPGRIRNPRAAHHSDQFVDPGFSAKGLHASYGSSVDDTLLNPVMMIGASGDLGQVCYAENLIAPRQFLQLLSHGFCCFPSDPGIHFIKDQCFRGFIDDQHRSKREHHARQFSPRSDLFQGAELFARICGNQKIRPVDSPRRVQE